MTSSQQASPLPPARLAAVLRTQLVREPVLVFLYLRSSTARFCVIILFAKASKNARLREERDIVGLAWECERQSRVGLRACGLTCEYVLLL